ncbi:MAG: hypothetical protein WC810_26705 [Janthinobacterium sp.]|jgi:uridine kinase
MIIGLVGKMGCGKGAVTSQIISAYPERIIKTVRFSDPLAEVCEIMAIPKTRYNLQHLAVVLKQGFGDGTLTKAVEERIKKIQADLIILEGIRWDSDYEMLRRLPDNKLIYVQADPEVRYVRIKQRKEKVGEAETTFEQFQKEDQAENEIYIEQIGAKADFTIDNNGTLDEMRGQVKNFIDKYL